MNIIVSLGKNERASPFKPLELKFTIQYFDILSGSQESNPFVNSRKPLKHECMHLGTNKLIVLWPRKRSCDPHLVASALAVFSKVPAPRY